MQARRMPDGRMAYELKYCGASPGRWSGNGGLNLQNLNRKSAESVDLRKAIIAPRGKKLAILAKETELQCTDSLRIRTVV